MCVVCLFVFMGDDEKMEKEAEYLRIAEARIRSAL
jgi:hypothetical protein